MLWNQRHTCRIFPGTSPWNSHCSAATHTFFPAIPQPSPRPSPSIDSLLQLPAPGYPIQPKGGGVCSLASLFARIAERYAMILATSSRRRASCLATHSSAPARPCS